jgi:hypothetical protein
MNVQRCRSPLVVGARGSDDPLVATCAACSQGTRFPVRLSGAVKAKGVRLRAVCLASANISSWPGRRSGSVVGDPDRLHCRCSAFQRGGRHRCRRAGPNALGDVREPSLALPRGNIRAQREMRRRKTPRTAQAKRPQAQGPVQAREIETRQVSGSLGAPGWLEENLVAASRRIHRWAGARGVGGIVPSGPAGRADA